MKKVGIELLYNPVHRKFNQLETRCGRESQHPGEGALRPPINQFGDQMSWREDAGMRTCPREAGPQVPGWAAQENGKETRLWPIEWGVNMLQFCSVSNSLSHTTLSIKWEVYFSKRLCRLSLLYRCVLHADVYVLCGYTTTLARWNYHYHLPIFTWTTLMIVWNVRGISVHTLYNLA